MTRPWFPFYPADYLGDTSHLSTVEHGAYLLLILHYWQKGGLPSDDRKLARIVRLPVEEWLGITDTIAELFLAGWRHKRVDQELATAEERYLKRSEAGRRGGRSAVKSPELPGLEPDESNAQALLHQPQSQPHSQSDLRSDHESPAPLSTTPREPSAAAPSLEESLREAAGPGSSIRRAGLAEIRDLIDQGASLNRHILPAIRAVRAAGRRGGAWSYYLGPIQDRLAGAVPAAGAVPQVVSLRILEGSPEGDAWEAYLRKETGKRSVFWISAKTPDQPRYRVERTRWPPGHPNHTPTDQPAGAAA